ncbi:MAG: cell division protein FtsL [Gaiellaceae bacterium]
MSTIAQGARSRPAKRTRSSSKVRARPRLLLGGGILWIVLFGALLAGVVAVNVTVLRLNVQLDQAAREQSQLKADIAGLRSQLSSASASARIESRARKDLGLVPADPDTIVYVELPR